MEKDESQTKKHREIISPKEALARIKARDEAEKKSEAERLFNQYCYPESHHWKSQASKDAALAMLGSRIFGDNVLKGHAQHKTTYPVELGALIYELVNVYRGHSYVPPIAYVKEDILGEFDRHFSYIAAMEQLAGARKDAVENYWDARREELSKAVDDSKISPDWRRLMEEKMFEGRRYRPKKMAYVFADVFLAHCLLAPPSRVADWVNAILTSLGRKCFSKSSLRDYVKVEQQKAQEWITEAGGDYRNPQGGVRIRF